MQTSGTGLRSSRWFTQPLMPLALPPGFVVLRRHCLCSEGDSEGLVQVRPGGLFFIGMAEGRADFGAQVDVLGPGAFRQRPG